MIKNWRGDCPICEGPVRFWATGDWDRDHLLCGSCQSIPRERALMVVIERMYPNWRDLRVHESSPGTRGTSLKLSRECSSYTASQYDPSIPFGSIHERHGYRSEDLERQTFADGEFDLVISQDVFEHVFRPDQAIQEIGRTLRPGGAHIMTVPVVNKSAKSRRRASIDGGEIVHHLEPQYHANPMAVDGSLVTIDWGYDIGDYLAFHSGMPTTLCYIDDVSRGIHAEYIEVIVSRKGCVPDLGQRLHDPIGGNERIPVEPQ